MEIGDWGLGIGDWGMVIRDYCLLSVNFEKTKANG